MKRVHEKDLDNTYTFIAKKDEWYIEGSKADLIDNCYPMGLLFEGDVKYSKDIHGEHACKLFGEGTCERDQELCQADEFDVFDKNGEPIEVMYDLVLSDRKFSNAGLV